MKIKEIDIEGEETLNAIAKADKFNYWMYSQMSPFIGGDILEIGSGIGNISKYLVTNFLNAELSDVRDQYTDKLKNQFPKQEVHTIDLVADDFEKKYSDLLDRYDFVFALNVVEHVKDDKLALINLAKLVRPGGRIFILVPAYQWLFNSFDVSLEHFRRYTKSTLSKICPEGCKVKNSFYFNAFGIIGWFSVGSILRRKIIPEGNMRIYNIITPIVKVIDILVFKRIGLSVICVFQRS
jgi:SAM-dependent methyltransferase